MTKQVFTLPAILIALTIIFIAGCKKETTDDPKPGNLNGLIQKQTYVNINPNTGDTSSRGEMRYTYDANGWQTRREEYQDGVLNATYTYVNSSSQVIESITNSSGSTTTDTMYLNAQGYVDHVSNIVSTEPRSYDADGHLIKNVFSTSGYVFTYTHTWINGNKTQMHVVSDPAYLEYTYNYTYSTDKKDYRNTGTPYNGKESTYMVLSNGAGIINWSYTYTYDSQGRVVTSIENLVTADPNQNNTKYVTYTYTN